MPAFFVALVGLRNPSCHELIRPDFFAVIFLLHRRYFSFPIH
jgi:hypothetical protein